MQGLLTELHRWKCMQLKHSIYLFELKIYSNGPQWKSSIKNNCISPFWFQFWLGFLVNASYLIRVSALFRLLDSINCLFDISPPCDGKCFSPGSTWIIILKSLAPVPLIINTTVACSRLFFSSWKSWDYLTTFSLLLLYLHCWIVAELCSGRPIP